MVWQYNWGAVQYAWLHSHQQQANDVLHVAFAQDLQYNKQYSTGSTMWSAVQSVSSTVRLASSEPAAGE
jgi:hypothetical protein